MDLVTVLLDFGADPNQETIGCLTVLNLCIMQYLHQKASAKAKSRMSSRSRNHFIVCPSYVENEASSSSEQSLSERSDSEYESTNESEDLECPVLTKKIWYKAELRWQLPSEPVVSQTPAPTFSRLATELDGDKPPRSQFRVFTQIFVSAVCTQI
ncbi:unnamed protein product [Dibothriocephalus latus]|uniref:Uncharacterized protein n=1 Tax=Dibothriocephalus latus TaxID=60516 RepID=A0A3P7P8T5_DIBLA|nr:unnamed protein product [Dibothriocephalus latus]